MNVFGNGNDIQIRYQTSNLYIPNTTGDIVFETGGGEKHRMTLNEMIMIKDNHLNSGNLEEIVNRSKYKFPNLKIEVEVENENQLDKVLFFTR